jgi:S-adenosylmethionine hydrolase
MRPVALLTDFGLSDHYAGMLHAVLLRDAPGCSRVDLGHQVTPGDVWQACHLLRSAWSHLPDDTVVLAVVDPGVGTGRRALAAAVGGRRLVAPDNGLAAAAGPVDEVVALDAERMGLPEPSRTFHGRDLFAPAAARLARGDDLAAVGDLVGADGLVACPLPEPRRVGQGWRGAVLHVDRFGNVVSNLRAEDVPRGVGLILPDGASTRRVRTYGDGSAGEVVTLEGSSGLLELSVNGGSAGRVTGLQRGDVVTIRPG